MPEPNSGCTLWLAAVDSNGYGRVWEPGIGRMLAAHRVAYEHKFGPIPQGMAACHKCDVPACVNPDHIFVGTHHDNMRDMVAKGRARGGVSGARNGNAKLTEEQVIEIVTDGGSNADMAARFSIVESAIWAIRNGHRWKHVTGPYLKVTP